MTLLEAVTVIIGLFAGYWAVNKLFFQSPPPLENPPKPPGATREWHEVLQVSPTASADEIRAAYRHLISQYHPDKVEQLGVELKELAARKSQEITVAYRRGLEVRGDPGSRPP